MTYTQNINNATLRLTGRSVCGERASLRAYCRTASDFSKSSGTRRPERQKSMIRLACRAGGCRCPASQGGVIRTEYVEAGSRKAPLHATRCNHLRVDPSPSEVIRIVFGTNVRYAPPASHSEIQLNALSGGQFGHCCPWICNSTTASVRGCSCHVDSVRSDDPVYPAHP